MTTIYLPFNTYSWQGMHIYERRGIALFFKTIFQYCSYFQKFLVFSFWHHGKVERKNIHLEHLISFKNSKHFNHWVLVQSQPHDNNLICYLEIFFFFLLILVWPSIRHFSFQKIFMSWHSEWLYSKLESRLIHFISYKFEILI